MKERERQKGYRNLRRATLEKSVADAAGAAAALPPDFMSSIGGREHMGYSGSLEAAGGFRLKPEIRMRISNAVADARARRRAVS